LERITAGAEGPVKGISGEMDRELRIGPEVPGTAEPESPFFRIMPGLNPGQENQGPIRARIANPGDVPYQFHANRRIFIYPLPKRHVMRALL
jgi:hypothetical protein